MLFADFICPTPKARELFNADFMWYGLIQSKKEDLMIQMQNVCET